MLFAVPSWVELAGYAASALVFATFYMKRLIPLRIAAMLSNVAFIVYAAAAGLVPILILHAALLPLNVIRTVQQAGLVRRIRRAAEAEPDLALLRNHMTEVRFPAGHRIFEAGDPADVIYFIVEGRVRFPSIDREIGAGALFGEIGLFTADNTRTAAAVCVTECVLGVIDKERILQLYATDLSFGVYLNRLIVSRLLENRADAGDRAPGSGRTGGGALDG